jgi:hypothetical protein
MPVREAEVIFMQQVTEIYGGEGGWDSLAWHGFTTMSIHTRQEICRGVTLLEGELHQVMTS